MLTMSQALFEELHEIVVTTLLDGSGNVFVAYCIFILFRWSLYCPFFTSSFSGRNYELLKSRLFVLFRSAFPASCCTYEQVFNILLMNK